MATYKVIQDIEAEDKLVGPFSLRQFIYACIAVLCGYFCFIVVAKGIPIFLGVFLPPLGGGGGMELPERDRAWSPSIDAASISAVVSKARSSGPSGASGAPPGEARCPSLFRSPCDTWRRG